MSFEKERKGGNKAKMGLNSPRTGRRKGWGRKDFHLRSKKKSETLSLWSSEMILRPREKKDGGRCSQEKSQIKKRENRKKKKKF